MSRREDITDMMWLVAAIIAIVFVLMLMLGGCCPCRHAQKVVSDSVMVNTIYIERIDTQIVSVPVERYVNVTEDTVSVIVGHIATSTATISNGHITHTLDVGGDVEVMAIAKESVRDSVFTHRETETVEVIRLTKFQRFEIVSFWVLFSIVLASLTTYVAIKIRQRK